MLEVMGERRIRGARGRAAGLRALGRAHGPVRRRRADGAPPGRGGDRRLRHRALLGRRRGLARVGAALRGDRLRGRRQLERLAHGAARAAGGRRGERRRARRPRGHRREPELLDDADGDGAEADPRRGRASSA